MSRNNDYYVSKNKSPASSSGTAERPEKYDSEYASLAKEVINEYLSREDFDYNVNTDKIYKQYADKYKREGESAMRDTIASASALTGGYGNSYAVTAGSQAYQGYLEKLNDIIPELEKRAFERYTAGEKSIKDKLSALSEFDDAEYEKYRDSMEDYFEDREFYEDNYRYREDADMEMYQALYDYILESEQLSNERQKIANDYKVGLLNAYN
ncbi:MAG: hypothetical protein E7591_01175 [Ruminococcaceae bacterium]|nr:hypothetical protein [Oscillospiraceae bacterium]